MRVYPSSIDPERKFEEHHHHHHHDHEGHFPTRWMLSIPDCPGPLVIQNILSRLSKISVWLHFVWFLFSLCFQFLNALVRALHIRRLHAAICFCTPLRSPSYVLLCACVSVLFEHPLVVRILCVQLYTHAIVVCAVCCVQALLWLMSSCALSALQLRQFLENKDQEDQTCLKLASFQFSLPCFAGRYSSNCFP